MFIGNTIGLLECNSIKERDLISHSGEDVDVGGLVGRY